MEDPEFVPGDGTVKSKSVMQYGTDLDFYGACAVRHKNTCAHAFTDTQRKFTSLILG